MRRDPVFLAYTITVPPGHSSQKVTDSLRLQTAPDSDLVDTCVSSEGTQAIHYRIGDFFEDIAIIHDPDGNGNQFRLVFHRRANAGKFWKDLMVRIIRALETDWLASVSLNYQGDVPLDWTRPMTVR